MLGVDACPTQSPTVSTAALHAFSLTIPNRPGVAAAPRQGIAAMPRQGIAAVPRQGVAAMPRAAAVDEGLRPALKRALDLAGAGAMLLVLAPVFLIIALLVRADGGPILFAHQRVGRDGRSFGCLKFRSMEVDADRRLAAMLAADPAARAEWETRRKLRHDSRVTRIGRVLRKTSLDELPQLLNVLRGDMSLVGPRPVTATELDAHYGAAAEAYRSVRPGITGPWQISGRSDTTYAQRVALDVQYAARPSLWTDIAILFRTPGAVLRRRGAY